MEYRVNQHSQVSPDYIRNIRPSYVGNQDKLIWSYTRNGGVYSVKSGSHLCNQRQEQGNPTLISDEAKGCCSAIWLLKNIVFMTDRRLLVDELNQFNT